MSDGIGCKCFASYQGECACDADWTPSEVYELKAHINDLREALEGLVDFNLASGVPCDKAEKTLSKTPAQSLQKHDNEVIEQVITLLKDTAWSDGIIDMRVDDLIKDVRALKGKQNE